MISRVLRPAVLLPAVLLLAACGGSADGAVAGTRLPSAPAGATAGAPAASTASSGDHAGLVEAAGLPPCPVSSSGPPPAGGLPELDLACLGTGPSVRLSGLRGTPTVITVWASWCGPCIRELPMLADAAADTAGTVRFLGVDLLDRPDQALQAAADLGVTFASVVDPDGSLRAAIGVPGPPVTLFVRPDGTVAYRHVGELPDRATLDALLEEHLGVTA